MQKCLKLFKENLFFLGIAFLLFFIPVYPKFPLFAVPQTYVSIRLEDIFVALIIGIFFLKMFLKKDFGIFHEQITKLIILYFAVGALSVISAIFITKNIVPHLAMLHFFRRIEYISLLFVAYFSLKQIKQLKVFGWIIFLATILVIMYGLGQKFFGWPVVSTMNREFSKGMILKLTWWARVNSTFAGHYDLAAYLVMILSLCAAGMIIVKKIAVKILIMFLWTLSFYLLLLTASRISFAAYLISVLFVLIFANKKWYIIPFLVLSILGMVFSEDLGQRYAATFKINLSFLSGKVKVKEETVAMIQPTITPTPVIIAIVPTVKPGGPKIVPTITPTPTPLPIATASAEPYESTALAVGRSTDIRLKVEWPRAIRAWLKNPLLGTGYSSITLATDNDYLRMLGETGLLGSLALFFVFAEIFRRFYLFTINKNSGKTEKIMIIGITGASLGYFINAGFIDVFEASKIAFFFWIMMGVGLKIIEISNKQINK